MSLYFCLEVLHLNGKFTLALKQGGNFLSRYPSETTLYIKFTVRFTIHDLNGLR